MNQTSIQANQSFQRWLHTRAGRFVTQSLIALLTIQGWPLQALSRHRYQGQPPAWLVPVNRALQHWVGQSVAQAQAVTCNGKVATIVGTTGGTLNGTNGDDVIVGLGAFNYTVNAGNGNDTICTGSGNDIINAGNGDDWIDAGSGNKHHHRG